MIILNAPYTIFGTDWYVYLLLFMQGVLVYFISKRLVSKFAGKNKRRTLITWMTTIVMTPVIYGLAGFIFILVISYYPNRDFDKAKWNLYPEDRYEMSKNIIISKMLLGKTKAEVKELLGPVGENAADSAADNMNEWEYFLGIKPGLGNIDNGILSIHFRNGKATAVTQYHE